MSIRTRKNSWRTALLLLSFGFAVAAAAQERPVRFVQETPWTVSALGIADEVLPVTAYWQPSDQQYYLMLADYLELLDYRVMADSLRIEAMHEATRIAVANMTGRVERGSDVIRLDSTEYFVSAGRFFVSFAGLQRVFEPVEMQFDHARLHITHIALRRRPPAQASPLLYGRSRTVLGSTHVDYRATRIRWLEYAPTYHGFARTHTNALGGRLLGEGLFVQADTTFDVDIRSLSYLVDFPQSAILTQFETGRLNHFGWPRQSNYDGIRLSNLPVANRFIQRETLLRGIAEPGAVVSASVGGVQVDRVYADQDGRYTLRIPVYYGSSQAQVEIAPIDGGPVSTRVRDLYVSQDLPPPGKLYYDARAGRESLHQDELMVFAEARYGLLPNLAIRAAYAQPGAPLVGLTQNWRGIAIDGEVALPLEAARARLWAQHRRLRLRGEAAVSEMADWSPYRRYYSGHLGWHYVRGSLFLQALHSTTHNTTRHSSFTGSGTISLSRSTFAVITGGMSRLRWELQEDSPWRTRWSSTITQAMGRGTRIGLHGEGGIVRDVDFLGVTLHGAWRWVSLGLRVGYVEEFAASFTLRLDTPWTTITNRSMLEQGAPGSHSQSIYGSMALGRAPQLMRQTRARSSAVLQAFLDTDRDGRRDRNEELIEDVDIQVGRAQVRQVDASKVRADLLVPHQRYQVTVDPGSLRHPRRVLTTGERFSFLADPGQSKRINIPVELQTLLDGVLEDPPAFSAARIMVLFFESDHEIARYEVSQEGRFSGRLAPGSYRVELMDVLGLADLSGWTRQVEVHNQPDQVLRLAPATNGNL
ncbi:MAG: hypothetical protein OXM02_15095 [Bacteroidota bacterium]|nr:hypothetical protein [Bacteroidota bacterium]